MFQEAKYVSPIFGNVIDYVNDIYGKFMDLGGNKRTCGPGWENVVQAPTSFHFKIFLEKDWYAYPVVSTVYNQKVTSYSLILEQQALIALQTQSFH